MRSESEVREGGTEGGEARAIKDDVLGVANRDGVGGVRAGGAVGTGARGAWNACPGPGFDGKVVIKESEAMEGEAGSWCARGGARSIGRAGVSKIASPRTIGRPVTAGGVGRIKVP